jgi:hypothetical protein
LEILSSLNALNPSLIEPSLEDISGLHIDAAGIVSGIERLQRKGGVVKPPAASAPAPAQKWLVCWDQQGTARSAVFTDVGAAEEKYTTLPKQNARILLRSDGVALRLWFAHDVDFNRKRVLDFAAKEGIKFMPFLISSLTKSGEGQSLLYETLATATTAYEALGKNESRILLDRTGRIHQSSFKDDVEKQKVLDAAKALHFEIKPFLVCSVAMDTKWNYVVAGSDCKEYQHDVFADKASAEVKYSSLGDVNTRRVLLERNGAIVKSSFENNEWKDAILGYADLLGFETKGEPPARKCAKDHALTLRKGMSLGATKCTTCKAKIHPFSAQACSCAECKVDYCATCSMKTT